MKHIRGDRARTGGTERGDTLKRLPVTPQHCYHTISDSQCPPTRRVGDSSYDKVENVLQKSRGLDFCKVALLYLESL